MTQVLIDRATLEQLVAALNEVDQHVDLKRYDTAPNEVLSDVVMEAMVKGRAAFANAELVKPIAFGRMIDGDIADVVCPETHEFYEGDYTVPLYTQPLAANNSAKTLKELAVKGCGKCFYQDCDFPNCCKPKMLSDILKDTL